MQMFLSPQYFEGNSKLPEIQLLVNLSFETIFAKTIQLFEKKML